MSTVTKPMALDETFNTTESTPRNQADVLAGIQQAIREGFGQVAYAVEYDNTDSGLTATNVQDAVDEVDAALDVVEDDIENIENDIESIKEVTGNPITLTDGSETYAQGLSVELEPVQDLHGQSAPYVGGAGKNKLPMTVEGIKDVNTDGTWSGNAYTISGVTFTILTNDGGNVTGINANGTASADILFYEATYLARGNIIYNGCPSGGSWASYCQVLIPSYAADYGDGASYNFTEESSQVAWIRIASGTSVLNKVFYPMVRLSTETDPTFAPWENICPISGYEGVEVTTADSDTDPTQSRTASVTFGQTMYGGRSNFTDGGTDDDRMYGTATFESIYNPSNPNVDWAVFTVTEPWENVSSFISNMAVFDNTAFVEQTKIGRVNVYSTPQKRLAVSVPKGSTTSDAQTLFSGLTYCIKKATPTTIQTPPTDLKLLKGTNNLTTNGTTITLDYIPNNSIGDAVKASEEYTDRAVERVAPKATLIDTWMISEESDTISVDLSSYDCNFFLLEYLFQSKRGTTLIPRPQGGTFSASVVTYNNGTPYYIELDYNPTTKELAYTSNVTSQFGILAIYTI